MTEPFLETTRRALDLRVAHGQVKGRAPSVAAAVVRDGVVSWVGGHGFVDDAAPTGDTQYRIGSITKTFVAVLIMRLRDAGRLALTDRLDVHLPETSTTTGVGSAQIGELLSHTAGLASETAPPWWERVDGAVRPDLANLYDDDLYTGGVVKHPAGRHFHYSNTGFGLLGAVVARLTGVTWLDALRRDILEPLGMTRTTPMPTAPHALGWAVHPWADLLAPEPTPDARLMAPAGQLWSTPLDLARFAAFLIDGSPDVLAAATLAEMRQPAAPPLSTVDGPSWESGFGLGMQLLRHDGRNLAGHGGSMPGFVASLLTSPADGLASVCFANATSGPAIGAIGADLISIVAKREPSLPAPWRPGITPEPALLALTGPWYWGATALALKLRGDGDLELAPLDGAGRSSRFTPQSDGTWLGLDGYYLNETLQAVAGADGEVSHLDIGSFVFTRQPYEPGRSDDPVPGGVDPQGWRGR